MSLGTAPAQPDYTADALGRCIQNKCSGWLTQMCSPNHMLGKVPLYLTAHMTLNERDTLRTSTC